MLDIFLTDTRDHPRLSGEHSLVLRSLRLDLGPPPPERGARAVAVVIASEDGTTPA